MWVSSLSDTSPAYESFMELTIMFFALGCNDEFFLSEFNSVLGCARQIHADQTKDYIFS